MQSESRGFRGFPFGMPSGWFRVAYSHDLEAGGIETLEYFGREMVLFRTATGRPGLLDAYCAHLGAHLGSGGHVEGEALACPFHGWRWTPEGSCSAIPYCERIPTTARTRSWPVSERCGMIFAWYDSEGRAPFLDPPEIPRWGEPGWTRDWTARPATQVAAHPQDVGENGVDAPHLAHLHGMQAVRLAVDFEGPRFHWLIEGNYEFDGDHFQLRIDGINHGLGFSVFERSGKRDTVACVSITPVREGCTEVQIAAIAEGDGDMTDELDELDDFLGPDVPIFQRKIYRADPILCENDGHVAEFRRWARQFYPAVPRPQDSGRRAVVATS